MYLRNPYPSYQGPLPNTDPNSANNQDVSDHGSGREPAGYVQNYNFTIQYELPHQTVIEAAYIGNKGTRMYGGSPGSGYTDYNGLPASLLAQGRHPDRSRLESSRVHCRTPTFDTSLSVAQALRPYPQYGQVNEQFPYNTNTTTTRCR